MLNPPPQPHPTINCKSGITKSFGTDLGFLAHHISINQSSEIQDEQLDL